MELSSLPRDTTLEAARVHIAILKKLSMEQRGRMASELTQNLRVNLEAGVRQRHPDYDDDTVRLAVAKLLLGPALFREAFAGVNVVP